VGGGRSLLSVLVCEWAFRFVYFPLRTPLWVFIGLDWIGSEADNEGNSTVFKADPKKEKVKVAECLVVKLEPAPKGKGVAGLWATELRVYMDFGAIHMKGKELMDLVKK